MDDKNTGGQAFPLSYEGLKTFGNPTGRHAEPGMTLRDYFAAHAPITMHDARQVWDATSDNEVAPTGRELIYLLAHLRMEYANSMLAAREAS